MSRLRLLVLIGLLHASPSLAAAPHTPQAARPSAAAELQRFERDYWEWMMSRYPLNATFIRHRGYDDKLENNTPGGRADDLKSIEAFSKRLAAIDPAALAEPEQVSWDMLKLELDRGKESFLHKQWQYDVDHMDGAQTWIPQVIAVAQPMATEKDAQALLARMSAFGPFFEAHLANLREGMAEGRTAARVAAERTIAQLKELIAKPAHESAFAQAAKRLPQDLQDRFLPLILREADGAPKAALEKYLSFLETEYLPLARAEAVGLSALPGGAEAYAFKIRWHTTLDKTAEELHETGLEELASIRTELQALADRAGHKGTVAEFVDKARGDPANFFTTREEIVASAKEQVERTRKRLEEFFGVLPKTALEVRPTEDYQEKNDAAARYFQPPDDLTRPGIYYINTYEPTSRPRYVMAALAAHEGLPGHHLQLALAIENRALSEFRRQTSFSAFVEGWGLYAERLADEMGLYPDDLSRLGMLSAQAWRACRLVVDTGIHAKGWTRQRAVDFMKANTAMSDVDISAEVDRYIIWPGQALAYKTGQREIMAIRREAEARQGKDFDLRAFHDAVLRNGAVPLPTLRHIVLGPRAK